MTLVEQIEQHLLQLPPDKQSEVLDFVAFLQLRVEAPQKIVGIRNLRKHSAFGSWKRRKVDALAYEQALRSEWDGIRVPYIV